MPDTNATNETEQAATFVVIGRIIKKKAATMPELAADDTLILEIDSVLKAPAMFSSLTGQQVTVRFPEIPAAAEGSPLTVYANGWIFGETIAVEAVGYSDVTTPREMAAKVSSDMASENDAQLRERLDSAQVAVVGKVVRVAKKEDDRTAALHVLHAEGDKTTHISEHDPNWHEATIEVNEVLKGTEAQEMTVLFPQSDDVRWFRIQKFQEGQQGIWLLQNSKEQNTKGISPKILADVPQDEEVLLTLHANDFLPLEELGKIKSLINQ